MRVFITGASGYVGGMLVERFLERPDIECVIALDIREPDPAAVPVAHPKLVWVIANLADNTWQERVRAGRPDCVIHCAFQIREFYGQKGRAEQIRQNIGGGENVFRFAFENPFVSKLIHFSTVSSYGALKTNSLDRPFTEEDPFRESCYSYGADKRVVEERLRSAYGEALRSGSHRPAIFIIRPAAISGPRGQHMFKRFGLVRVLKEKRGFGSTGGMFYRTVASLVRFIPVANPLWSRQYVHEDDLAEAVMRLADPAAKADCETFILSAPGCLLASDFARITGKRTFRVMPWMVRIAFFLFWHLSRGGIPTSPCGWRFYSYPLVVDGSKITRTIPGFCYEHSAEAALRGFAGRYGGLARGDH